MMSVRCVYEAVTVFEPPVGLGLDSGSAYNFVDKLGRVRVSLACAMPVS
jgi:hypothetical protein